MPALHVPYAPCPFVCKDCGRRGEIKDRAEAPAGYAEVSRTGSTFVTPAPDGWQLVRKRAR